MTPQDRNSMIKYNCNNDIGFVLQEVKWNK